jgi:histidinol-phosphate/aromatic aminotransferase/cobyric acid decarboxylase-like protein
LPPTPAEEAVKDTEYAEKTLAANHIERKFLGDSLARLNLSVYPSFANFLFLELPTQSSFAAAELRSYLIKNHGIIVRNCSTYSGLKAGKIYPHCRSQPFGQRTPGRRVDTIF